MSAIDIPISTIAEARRLAHAGRAWRVRLTFEGPNPENKSGRSSKWWEASCTGGGGYAAVVRWGVISGKGQAQTGVDPFAALDRAEEKARKGYREAQGAGSSFRWREGSDASWRGAPQPTSSFAALVLAATWRPFDLSRLGILAGERGLVRLDLPGAEAQVDGAPAIPYLAADGALYGVARSGDRYLVAVLRSAA